MQPTKRVTVALSEAECEALRILATAELRDPREQARYLLRQALGLTNEGVPPQQMKSHTSVRQDITGVAAS